MNNKDQSKDRFFLFLTVTPESSSGLAMPPLTLNYKLFALQVHPHRGSGQRVPRRSRARGGDHGPGTAAGGPVVELPGSRGAGGTLRPGGQLAQPGLHGIHLTCVWRCHCSGSRLSQLGKRVVVCLCVQNRMRKTELHVFQIQYEYCL